MTAGQLTLEAHEARELAAVGWVDPTDRHARKLAPRGCGPAQTVPAHEMLVRCRRRARGGCSAVPRHEFRTCGLQAAREPEYRRCMRRARLAALPPFLALAAALTAAAPALAADPVLTV